ncbi:MAG: hypothetical protein A2Y14_00595 [Verrucomicrobia bacterium GWF2_51_19]|nr:MAG: hypothetical protein A2Y14_00595 [Verrucomicrobia bacterium GWF2_51_19]HCJ11629.1 hypothetical protein [Opitutae bacterium]
MQNSAKMRFALRADSLRWQRPQYSNVCLRILFVREDTKYPRVQGEPCRYGRIVLTRSRIFASILHQSEIVCKK